MTLSITGSFATLSTNDTQHNKTLNLEPFSVIMLSVAFHLLSCCMSLCWQLKCAVPLTRLLLIYRAKNFRHDFLPQSLYTVKGSFTRRILKNILHFSYSFMTLEHTHILMRLSRVPQHSP